jgi:hypothetical protein
MSFIATIRQAACSSAAVLCLFAASGAEAGGRHDPLVIPGIGPQSYGREPVYADDYDERGPRHSRPSYARHVFAHAPPVGRRMARYGAPVNPYDREDFRPAAYTAADADAPPPRSYGPLAWQWPAQRHCPGYWDD